MTLAPNSLEARDVAYYFHPATNARRHEQVGPLVLESGRGVFVKDDQGKEYIEGLAGLWSVAVGFGEPRLVEAAARQMAKLPYYHSFAGKSHPQAIALAERLVKLAGGRVAKAQFTSSGSEANDFVVKLVWYYNNALGRPKKKTIVSREKGYHGVSVASGSLTGLPAFHRDFDLPIANVRHLTAPHYWRSALPGETEDDFSERLMQEFEALIRNEGADTIAAFIAEPVMGAGGVVPPPAGYWPRMQALCRKHDILLIADEVITGFGRTGALFASHKYGIAPDVLVVSKALTSSYFPLSAVLISDALYQAVADNSAKIGTFAHGFTASGHPVGAAVAMENLDIIEERDLVAHVRALEPHFQRRLSEFAGHPLIGEARGVGLIGALEFVADKPTKAAFDQPGVFGARLAELCQDEGLIIRAIGETIAFCPPLIITAAEIDELFARFGRALKRM
ncbi:aspartate aminotransferase family protein [Roseiarcus sp.]|uniref:aspartate aminotransferase family protein n=1 Tax=Roseiarcus sp. TaxID=1969460 RepID=UPI003F9CAF4A